MKQWMKSLRTSSYFHFSTINCLQFFNKIPIHFSNTFSVQPKCKWRVRIENTTWTAIANKRKMGKNLLVQLEKKSNFEFFQYSIWVALFVFILSLSFIAFSNSWFLCARASSFWIFINDPTFIKLIVRNRYRYLSCGASERVCVCAIQPE